ncbi:MAG: phosphatase PAP2 family protein [Marinagarivorans sp.]
MSARTRFLLWYCLLPGILTLAAFIAIRVWQLDEKMAGLFLTDRQWPYKDNFWLLNVIHNGGHKASLVLYAGVFIYWLKGKINGAPAAGLAYVLSAVGLSVVLINLSKHILHFPCPWQALNDWGAFIPYQWRPDAAGCFPSGHASSGWAWLCLYYLGRQFYPAQRFILLAPAVLIGLVFGSAQQLRGAHFISHDLVCIYLCWLVASLLYCVWPGFKSMFARDTY